MTAARTRARRSIRPPVPTAIRRRIARRLSVDVDAGPMDRTWYAYVLACSAHDDDVVDLLMSADTLAGRLPRTTLRAALLHYARLTAAERGRALADLCDRDDA